VALLESRSLSFSILLHVAAVLVAAFVLPALLPPRAEPMPLVMTVELLPVGETTNIKPSEKPIQKEKKAPTPKTTKPVQPTVTEKPKEPKPPTPTADKKPFDPTEETVPSDKAKPKDKPKEEAKPKEDDFEALLNKLKQEAKTDKSKEAKDSTNSEENKTRSDAAYDDSMPLSISEKDTIRSQFLTCWTMPAGSKDAHTLAVRIKMELQADGTVLKAVIAPDQMGRYNSEPFFRAAADSALRAVFKCSPLKNLPPEKYGSWREMELNFDPQDLQ
jgi:outer membrane biosynthesis protein TonB